jgi:hypothetical protein
MILPKQLSLILVTLFIFFKSTQPARADFSLVWVATGIVVGIMIEKYSHSEEASEDKDDIFDQ